MMRIFRKISSQSVKDAKNRLKSVINNDRMNVSCDMTLEKMRKEVSAVLLKYTKKNAQPQVSVSFGNGAECILSASVLLNKEPSN